MVTVSMYTTNRGIMEPWVKFFAETIVPCHEKIAIKIEGSRVNEDDNQDIWQYIWIRAFDDAEDLEIKMTVFLESPELRSGLKNLALSYLARLDPDPMRPV